MAIVEGLPAGLPVNAAFIDHELWRRQQGYGRGGRMKIESDKVNILSGARRRDFGSPMALLVETGTSPIGMRSMSVEPLSEPTSRQRRVIRPRPGMRTSRVVSSSTGATCATFSNVRARETTMRVAAGSLARLLLAVRHGDRQLRLPCLGDISLNRGRFPGRYPGALR